MGRDPLQERLERLKRLSSSASRRSELYCDMAGMGSKIADGSLSPLRRAPAPGRKVQKIGFIMFWIPEPTGITCAMGAPMILAGRYLDKKYNGATIGDIGSETKKTLSTIKNFKSSVT